MPIEPVRFQLKRTAGWRKPENSISVARPTRWGNPFVVRGPMPGQDAGSLPFRIYFNDNWKLGIIDMAETKLEAHQKAVDLFSTWFSSTIAGENTDLYHFRQRYGWYGFTLACVCRNLLHGKNLGCWCGLDIPCHGNVILKRANPELFG